MKKTILRFIKSLKLRVFVTVLCAMLIPVVVCDFFIMNVAVNSYLDNRIERFKSNNTMLKNSIISEGFIEKQESDIINTLVEQLSREYNCRVEIVNSRNIILKDTDSSKKGKTSIAECVLKALKGESQYKKDEDNGYVEFALPISINVTDPTGKSITNTVGALYINYSIADIYRYRNNLTRYALMVMWILVILALVVAGICAHRFVKPIMRVEESIEQITRGKVDEVSNHDYSEIEQRAALACKTAASEAHKTD